MGRITESLFNLKGRNIVIGGGAGQIGYPMAVVLADAGANIAIVDIDEEMALSKVDALNEKEIKDKIFVYRADVSKKDQVMEIFKKINNELGNLYGLVNCFHFKGNTRKLDTGSNFFAGFEDYPEEIVGFPVEMGQSVFYFQRDGVIAGKRVPGGRHGHRLFAPRPGRAAGSRKYVRHL